MPNKIGSLAEELAGKWLIKNGFKIIAKNVWLAKYGEIDIIAKKGRITHFVEVKGLKSIEDFSPEIHFTKAKKQKLVNLARHFANKNNLISYQIDLLTLEIEDNGAKIRYYTNADA